MLFNSYVFLFAFMPVVLIGYSIAGRFHRKAVVAWLAVASLVFYGYWYPAFLLVLGTSILTNFLFSNLISRTIPNSISTRLLLWVSIFGNLAALCWFKYLFPFLNMVGDLFHAGHHWGAVLLPLGISFFTFTQIAYLVDLQQGAAEQQDFFSYLLFVTFFPHVIAGPILHHKDIMPQFQQDRVYQLRPGDLAVGFSWFIMGLFKKVMIADKLAPFADHVFGSHGETSSSAVWIGVFSYSLQLYFDFSGYCDMACGLARMLSVDFPLNFSSPYKARNIIDYWQRWHMTLTQYIGAYLYSPVQFWITRRRRQQGKSVTRKAQATAEGFFQMVAFPTIFSMFIAGIWHGAGMQFLIFGLLHGFYLTVVHAWRLLHRPKVEAYGSYRKRVNHAASVLLTYMCVVLGALFFRAPSVKDAMLLLGRMFRMHLSQPSVAVGPLRGQLAMVIACLIIVWAFPNTQQILVRYKPALHLAPADELPRLLPIYWQPTLSWSLLLGTSLVLGLASMQDPSTFLYFQF